MSFYPLDGKVAIVTGAGSGIGHALTKLLLSARCSVVLADLKLRPQAEQLVADYQHQESDSTSPTATFHPTDVSDWTQLTSLWTTAVDRLGRVDIVASVAGVYELPSSSFWNPPGISPMSCDPADASRGQYMTLAINQIAPIRLAQIAIDYWTQNRHIQGNFLAVSSIAAYYHYIDAPLYVASKAALIGFVKSLGEVRDLLGIRMSAVCPGATLTPLFENEWEASFTANDTCLTPEECAAVILRVLQEPQWGNGSIVETQKVAGEDKAPSVAVRDVQLELLYPKISGRLGEQAMQKREALKKRLQETGMRL